MAFTKDRLERLQDVLDAHVERGNPTALVWLVDQGGEVHTGTAGTTARDAIFRIASMTKPVTAVAALILVEECRLRLDDPVDDLLPELADRRVLTRPDGRLDDTVPAHRPITLRDLLTFRVGVGMDFEAMGRGDKHTVLEAMADLGLGVGAPAPEGPPPPDEWIRRLGTLPLQHQPGERWLYHTGAEILGVLVARASGQPFDAFLRERLLEPLGMKDTAFAVTDGNRDRLGTCYTIDFDTGERLVYDPPDGQWSHPPAFPSGGAGLVSTVDDYHAFAQMLREGGAYRGERILARTSVDAMVTDHLEPEQGGPDAAGAQGWGFGVGIVRRRTGTTFGPGSYGWDGGLGTVWTNDPSEDLTGVMLTDQAFTSPALPPVCQDFWTGVYAALS